MTEVFIVAAALVALAELGDKTQVLSLVLASRYPSRWVFAGVLVAILALQALAVMAGGLIGTVLPRAPLAVVTVALFIVFGVWSLLDAGRDGDEGEGEVALARRGAMPVVALVAGAFFMAELGDKTQMLTLAIAADPAAAGRTLSLVGATPDLPEGGLATYLAVWLGSTAGMIAVNGAAIMLGSVLGARLPRPIVARVSGVAFIVFGVLIGAAHLLS
ncbi:MAG: TMEM165/GDT1 family protein [Clostridiales bacterium]|nr:TMEM165/GDT1 family protein [Clostridiales bacterium]